MKFLVFTTDLLPAPGLPTSGTALRTFGIVQGLRANGHTVDVSIPRSALAGFDGVLERENKTDKKSLIDAKTREMAFDSTNQSRLIHELEPDVIICGHWPAYQLTRKPHQKLFIDLAGPHILERHFQKSLGQNAAMLSKAAAMASADGYIVSGPRQAEYFKSFLARAAKPSMANNMVIVTMPLSPEMLTPTLEPTKEPTYPKFIFGGIFLPWQDPTSALTQVAETLREKKMGKLTLIGGKHPHYKVKSGIYESLFDKLSENSFVETLAMQPYENFIERLHSSDVAVDLMAWNLERELAVTIRSTTYLWSGLPVIYNNFSDLSDLISEYDAGWCISPSNKSELAEVLNEILSNPQLVRNKSKNALRLAREVFSWDKAVLPILELCDNPELLSKDISVTIPDSAKIPLSSRQSISQKFLSRMAGLQKIEILVTGKTDPQHKKTFSVQLRRYKACGELSKPFAQPQQDSPFDIVAEKNYENQESFSIDWLSLELDLPEQNSKGVWYEIVLESDSEHDVLSPWTIHACPYPLASLCISNKELPDSALCIQTWCNHTET